MTYATDLAAMVAALDTALARERARRRIHSACVSCKQPDSRCECNPEPPEPEYLTGHAADVAAGRNYPSL